MQVPRSKKIHSDLVSGVVFFFGGILWAAIAHQFVPLTRIGVVIIAAPSLVLTAVGVFHCGLYFLDKLRRQD